MNNGYDPPPKERSPTEYPTTAEYIINGQKALVTRVFKESPPQTTGDILLRLLRADAENKGVQQ